MPNLKGLVSVVAQLREERTNLVNSLRHVDAALSVLGRLNGGKTQAERTRTISASGRKKIAAAQRARCVFGCEPAARGSGDYWRSRLHLQRRDRPGAGSRTRQRTGFAAAPGQASCIDGHVDPRQIMDVGVMNGNIPAPLMAIDEDDEFFLTLTNVGMIMRPDLFEQHTVHFHGYPNASSFYDGVPDASVAINIGGSFTYYYLAPDAGTYFWHCHITPPEHLQMGMVGQIYVRPRQNRVPCGNSLHAALLTQQGDLRTACNSAADILCTNPCASRNNGVTRGDNRQLRLQRWRWHRPTTMSSIPSRSTGSIPTSTSSA